MKLFRAFMWNALVRLGFVAMFLLPLALSGQEVDRWKHRQQVLTTIQSLSKSACRNDLPASLLSRFENLSLLKPATRMADATESYRTMKSDGLGLGYTTNSTVGVFFIRPDYYNDRVKYLESASPLIIVSSKNKTTVIDMMNLSRSGFMISGYCFFHGFLTMRSEIPSLIISVGPSGSANSMTFCRIDFALERDGSVTASLRRLVEHDHVVDFHVDIQRSQVTVEFVRDKWDSRSRTNDVVSLSMNDNRGH